jgi:hypothetical protein
MDRVAVPEDVAELRHLIDHDAVVGQPRAQRFDEAALRLRLLDGGQRGRGEGKASTPVGAGPLRLSLVTCPVALYPATSTAKTVRFNPIDGGRSGATSSATQSPAPSGTPAGPTPQSPDPDPCSSS